MREIKFRGKQIDTLEWIYGYFTKTPEGLCKIHFQPFAECSSNTYFFVFPESVGQYTGLKDKNGKEIYEGDIVEMSDPYGETKAVCEIRFVNGGFIVEANGWFNAGEADITTIGWAIEQEIKVEVIGNIYENKELLENDKNN